MDLHSYQYLEKKLSNSYNLGQKLVYTQEDLIHTGTVIDNMLYTSSGSRLSEYLSSNLACWVGFCSIFTRSMAIDGPYS